jgi:hypothetical protein
MEKRALLPPETIRKLIDYDPQTGTMTWLHRGLEFFADGKQTKEHNQAIWNGKFAGKPAFNLSDRHGYKVGVLNYRQLKAHRVAWAMHYGEWPKGDIDHINGQPADNRICNLRDVPHKINNRNNKKNKNNTSGVCGVYRMQSGRWQAKIMVDGKYIPLGTFETKEAAASARRIADQAHGFQETHGRRA